jgi:hypothetical protein
MEEYNQYGKVILKRGIQLFHWSNDNNITTLNNNFFLTICNHLWKLNNKYMYTFKLKKDIELLLTINNKYLNEHNTYSNNIIRYDSEIITYLYNDLIKSKSYSRDNEVKLKMNKTHFNSLCNALNNLSYNGMFNYIDGNKGIFETVIFNPSEYLEFVAVQPREDIKMHDIKIYKRKLLSNKINFIYPYKFDYIKKKWDTEPSIFYYIYMKLFKHIT